MNDDLFYIEVLEALRDNLLKPMHKSIVSESAEGRAQILQELSKAESLAAETKTEILAAASGHKTQIIAALDEVKKSIDAQTRVLESQEKLRQEETAKLCLSLKSLKWD